MSTPLAEPLEVDCPAAACVATWRRLLEPRPMDPDLPIVFNDAELYRRLRAQAYRCEVIPGATAAHAYGTSLQRVARARMRAEFVASMRRYQSPVWSRTKLAALWTVLVADAITSAALGGAARTHARGTLGGLGLPGGAAPWLADVGTPARRATGLLRRARPGARPLLRRLSRRARRRWFIVRLHLAAWIVHARITTDIHPSVDVPRRATFEIRPRSRPVVRLAREVQVQPGLVLRLGGDLDLGARSQLRYDVSLNVNGRLRFDGRGIAGRGCTIHADGDMVWAWGVVVGELSSIIDSDHAVDGVPIHPFDQPVHQRDIRLGAGTFIGAHSTVTAGVTIGPATTVGAGSIVSRSLPGGVLALGAPAAPKRAQVAAWAVPDAETEETADRVAR
jgi:acetyltransferase-like isoleucine patch superfamily enzyme